VKITEVFEEGFESINKAILIVVLDPDLAFKLNIDPDPAV
jgi:hypothetical protein